MAKPKTLVPTTCRDSTTELSALYVLTTIAAIQLMGLHWLAAMALAPFIIGATLFGLVILVELLWVTTVGIDRLGSALGLRKSPLA